MNENHVSGPQVLNRDGIYDRGDNLTYAERERFGIKELGMRNDRIKAVWTGEKRPPKAGEWYLSGSGILAYRALSDYSHPYHIATLVETETKTVTTTRIVRR